MKNKARLDSELQRAARAIREGGVVAFPTETSYGTGCDPRNETAVRHIFRIKKRDASKPLPLIASSIAQVKKLAKISGNENKFAAAYWPGPLTLILPQTGKLAHGVTKNGVVAIRVSSSEVARSLARRVGFPIVATSLNRSGHASICDLKNLPNEIRKGLDAIIDIGTLPKRMPSTIARIKDDEIEVLRQGAIKL